MSAEQAGMSRDGVLSLRQFLTECMDVFMLKLGADPFANVKPLVVKLRDVKNPCEFQLKGTLRRS
jgi:hypothetical protein